MDKWFLLSLDFLMRSIENLESVDREKLLKLLTN